MPKAVALAMLVATSAATASAVDAPAGPIEGVAESGVDVFRGIPYAMAPIGALRWRAPKRLARWSTPLKADKFGPVCMQGPPGTDLGVGPETRSEDCLTLNIWAPSTRRSQLPVMVWLHGGGYTSGSGSARLFDGSALARRGVILVTLNYRLGRFGFFSHPELAATGKGANFGLLDQRAALSWVRDNIAAFGGDPTRVTLFGNSAGGESVLFHMTMPASRGLFARAIVQSGLGGRHLRDSAVSADAGHATVPLADLRTLPASEILAWGTPSIYRGFGPVIDNVTVTEPIETAFRARRQARVPLIIGYNGFEIPPAAIGGVANALAMVDQTAEQRAAGIDAYGSVKSYEQRIASDLLFRMPALRLARLHAASGVPTWAYEFDIVAAAVAARLAGAPHASERAYVFGTLAQLGWPTDARDGEAARALGDRWTRFAASGSPVTAALPWDRARRDDAHTLVLTNATDGREIGKTPALAEYFGLR